MSIREVILDRCRKCSKLLNCTQPNGIKAREAVTGINHPAQSANANIYGVVGLADTFGVRVMNPMPGGFYDDGRWFAPAGFDRGAFGEITKESDMQLNKEAVLKDTTAAAELFDKLVADAFNTAKDVGNEQIKTLITKKRVPTTREEFMVLPAKQAVEDMQAKYKSQITFLRLGADDKVDSKEVDLNLLDAQAVYNRLQKVNYALQQVA